MKTALLVIALIAAAAAAPRNPQRIVGGTPTTNEIHPYSSNMEHLWWGFMWSQTCGGTLITSTTVVSAAHCYIGDSPSTWRVRLGSAHPMSAGSLHPTSGILLHASYSDLTLDYDTALIYLATPAIFGSTVGTARIAGPNYILADHTSVKSIGLGALSAGGQAANQLQEVDVNIINQQVCADRYAFLKTQPGYQNWPDITNRMMCTGILDVGGKDACQGDSGGAQLHNGDVLVGITSWGFSCAHPFYPGVVVRVHELAQWIIDNA